MNLKTILAITAFWITLFFFYTAKKEQNNLKIETDSVPVQYVGTLNFESVSIRVLVLKHTFEQMANDDAALAISAANLAASKGLSIEDIGEHNIDRTGKVSRTLVFHKTLYPNALKEFIAEQMQINKRDGDTVIVFTIGHGFRNGGLQTLGQRREIMEAIAKAAEENEQETVWWQLSCYASANLPKIQELTLKQQDILTVVASSDSKTQSPAYVEGKVMQKVFLAMAEKSEAIDPNKDEIIIAEELARFLNNIDRGRGNLVYAKSPQEPVFGIGNKANRIPIRDRNNPQQEYPRDYIPMPSRPNQEGF